jgi:sialic acid synthase
MKQMRIQLSDSYIGSNKPCYIIAEGGINHQGSVTIAKQLIDVAKTHGANCIKFQKRTIHRILTKEGLEAPYTSVHSFGATYGEHKEKLELSEEDWRDLKQYADQVGIPLIASGWDEEAVDFLQSIDVPFFKMASADLTNFPLLEHTAKLGKPMILSTGMASLDTVKQAVAFVEQWCKQIVLLHCTSTYPCPMNEINLRVIQTYQQEFPQCVIGYSGHEKGIAISLAAVVMGAKVVERHITLDRTMKGNDHAASLEPDGLGKLVRDIRAFEDALGNGIKTVQTSEIPVFKKLAKSIVYTSDLPKGTCLTREHLTTKGPGTGISPIYLMDQVGKVLVKDVCGDTLMKETDVSF